MRAQFFIHWLKRLYLGFALVFTTLCALALVVVTTLLLISPHTLPPQLSAKADLMQYALSDWRRWAFGAPGQRAAHFPPIEQWQGQGARPLELPAAAGHIVLVDSTPTFLTAIKNAQAGDIIRLHPGIYRLQGRNIAVSKPGLPDTPIIVEAARLGDVMIELDMLEGFLISAPHWIFQNLDIRGVCKDDSACEHAFHIVGAGHHTLLRNNRIHDFNAALKANGTSVNGMRTYPDQGRVEHNSFYATRPRVTANPVTPLDMVGVSGWIVRGNLIADFAKARGDKISYGAFFKGGGQKNILERNLIACAMHLPQQADTRIGLSFGGGGTDPASCRTQPCSPEHTEGVMRHNIILHCSDVGIYLNRAANSAIYNNTLFDTRGIDVRFSDSFALLANNLLDSRIATRDGGTMEKIKNTIASHSQFAAWFTDADTADFSIKPQAGIPTGNPLQLGETDFCGHTASGNSNVGAVQISNKQCRPDRMITPIDKSSTN